MKYRTNRQRAERKLKKAADNTKQAHINYHIRPGYHEIIAKIREKVNYIVTRNAHPGRKIEKEIVYPRVLWNNGTYRREAA